MFFDDITAESKNQMIYYVQSHDGAQDQEILYDLYVYGGGPAINTETWYLGNCSIWVQTIISKSYASGFVRNNPDRSFYPGDGFNFSFVYGWVGDPLECRSLTVCPVKSHNISPGGTQDCDFQNQMVLSDKVSQNSKTWFTSETAEISPDENASEHYIQLQINAQRWGCYYPRGAPYTCGWISISTIGSFMPVVLKPNVQLHLSQEYLNDSDGYVSANLDETYYLWDAINVVHNPVYSWKKDRVGTLSVRITKMHDLVLEKEFQCTLPACIFTLTHNGFEPWSRQYEYGGGTSLYNATQKSDIKKHLVVYQVSLYNLGVLVHKSENQTRPLVVVYDPVYDIYPYIVLNDKHWWSWSNRQAVALDYRGSSGGGSDDTTGIHENRRSKINHYVYEGYAFNPVLRVPLSERLSWNEASPIESPLVQNCFDEKIDPSSFEVKVDKTAMFNKAGSGKIAFSYPILKTMLEKRYINATIQNVLQSVDFAGYKIKNLTEYTYQYPDVKFSNLLKILTYNSDGSRTGLPIHVIMTPDIANDAQYTHDYVCSKVIYDTNNARFADIVVSDMYDRTNWGNNTGYLNLRIHLTSTWFPSFYSILAGNTLDLPLHQGYKTLSPYEITMIVGEKSRTMSRIVSFLSPFVHVVNLDQDNLLNVTESSGFVRINPDEKFGNIVKVDINGITLKEDCTNGCTTTIHENQDLEIEAWNIWDGRATAYIKKAKEDRRVEASWDPVLFAAITMIIGLLLWKFYGQLLNALGLRRF